MNTSFDGSRSRGLLDLNWGTELDPLCTAFIVGGCFSRGHVLGVVGGVVVRFDTVTLFVVDAVHHSGDLWAGLLLVVVVCLGDVADCGCSRLGFFGGESR